MKFIVGLLFFSSSLLTVSLQAQSILKGIVKSETGTAVPYASIQLLQPDSTFVQGTAADSTGNYKMTVRKGEYLMSVSSIGYLTKTIPVISNGENDRTLPVITLQTNNIMLNNIEIKYEDVIDIKLPFSDLGINNGDIMEMFFATSDNGIKDTYIPNDALLVLKRG